MKNTPNSEANQSLEDELLPEYNFDYNKARPNHFAIPQEEDSVSVKLEPDVAKVFKTSEAVNKALRAILSPIPQK
ncbi:MAG: hypothetical protein QNJ70_26070 [Xenococcaceae cyanobacterium MO_207.B15]|nr:hypothetical protein [Xenococcaceae cyanobacterium MO_207.B15]